MAAPTRPTPRPIVIRGAAVNNLKSIDLDIPARKLIVICGVSGSGKSSLAFDVLYAEGQRRYIESLPNSVRPFLPRLDRPRAERIDGVRPAIAVSQTHLSVAAKTTVAGAAEIIDDLRLAMARLGRPFCCGRPVRAHSPQTAAQELRRLAPGAKFMVAFDATRDHTTPEGAGGLSVNTSREPGSWSRRRASEWKAEGFARAIASDVGQSYKVVTLDVLEQDEKARPALDYSIVVDRLTAGPTNEARTVDALETAYSHGEGRAEVFIEAAAAQAADLLGDEVFVDGAPFLRATFSRVLECSACGRIIPPAEPRLFNPAHPLGACPTCEGLGEVLDYDFEKIVPDPTMTLREGAVAAWHSTPYEAEQPRFEKAAAGLAVPLDTPVEQLTGEQREALWRGSEESGFPGVQGFFTALEAQKHKTNVRTFLARFRSPRPCPSCHGLRLRPEALAYRLGGKTIGELEALTVGDATTFLTSLPLEPHEQPIARTIFDQTLARLAYLAEVGLGYLELSRRIETLSAGEARRVALTKALGSNLVDAMYILDEPSVGLHPRERESLVKAVRRLAARGNTVLVVEHNTAFLEAADEIIEIGPNAGDDGGRVVFQGRFDELQNASNSVTADFLSGRRGKSSIPARRRVDKGKIVLRGASGRTLKNIDATFPIGALCVVAGPSGAGKSTLVADTLYPAICRALRIAAPRPLEYAELIGADCFDDVALVDQESIGRSPKSNAATYIKAFDEIREVYAETPEAKVRNYGISHFSFNSEQGRCGECDGAGVLAFDMQFLPDVYVTCPVCRGTRYRREILDVNYRDRSIAKALDLTAREAFAFFHGRGKLQAKLKALVDVGLGYLKLGQPANTLSGGEAQRLKLATRLTSSRSKTLLILDEPTGGLHPHDVQRLLECFDALLSVGASLIVVDHHPQLLAAADWVLDLGPGSGPDGGQLLAQGRPEDVAQGDSPTAEFIAAALLRKS